MGEYKMMLPGQYYTSTEIFARELDRFFINRWVCIGRREEISMKGQFIVREVAGESILLINDGKKINAFFNVCRHRGTKLCEAKSGTLPGRLQCAYHAWTYMCDGSLVSAPGMNEVAGFDRSLFGLNPIAVNEWDGHLFIHIGANPPPLSEQLGALQNKFSPWHMMELQLAKRINYSIEANWKLLIQNYSECLHCPTIHPALEKLSHAISGDNEPAHSTYLGGRMKLNDGIQSMTMSGESRRACLPGLDPELRRHVYYYWMIPNLLLSLHPDYMMTHTLWPIGPALTKVICEFHFHPSEILKPGFTAEDASEFWDLTNRQDWHVSELTQKGVSSRGYIPGPYSPRETLLWGLDAIVRT